MTLQDIPQITAGRRLLWQLHPSSPNLLETSLNIHLLFLLLFHDLSLFKVYTPKWLMPLETDTSNTVDSGYFLGPVFVIV